jgi:hypothetical protein
MYKARKQHMYTYWPEWIMEELRVSVEEYKVMSQWVCVYIMRSWTEAINTLILPKVISFFSSILVASVLAAVSFFFIQSVEMFLFLKFGEGVGCH